MDSRVLCDQQLNERMPQRFAPFSDLVNKCAETELEREFLLGNASMGAQPTPPQRPEALHGMHLDCTQAVASVITGVRASSMVDALMLVSPRTQARIHHVDDHLTTPLHHPTDRGPLLLQDATAPLAFASVSTSFASLVLYHLREPLMTCNRIRCVALHLV